MKEVLSILSFVRSAEPTEDVLNLCKSNLNRQEPLKSVEPRETF